MPTDPSVEAARHGSAAPLEEGDELRVRVPASTSNLGPGFDVVGLALTLHLDVRAVRIASDTVSTISEREGEAAAWPSHALDADEPFGAALRRASNAACIERGWRFDVRSEIPVARGLGSSGAATAAGLLLGHAIAHPPHPRPHERSASAPPAEDLAAVRTVLCRSGIELEGHPENVSASLFGGCTLSLPRPGDTPLVVPHAVHPDLAFAVAWPDEPMRTAEARAALPANVPLADAVENARRLAFLLQGLGAGDAELLRAGAEDRLHVPYRLALLPGAERALDAARSAGAWLATLSGSGSALFAICAPGEAEAVASAMAESLRSETGAGHARVPLLASTAPRVERG